ncbi:MAG: hypothetical protein PF637_09915 [Spirochaetes bacterium]|jgi:hypothetical protein|nr:hypothetical protein [Spirochaetota bacterium]
MKRYCIFILWLVFNISCSSMIEDNGRAGFEETVETATEENQEDEITKKTYSISGCIGNINQIEDITVLVNGENSLLELNNGCFVLTVSGSGSYRISIGPEEVVTVPEFIDVSVVNEDIDGLSFFVENSTGSFVHETAHDTVVHSVYYDYHQSSTVVAGSVKTPQDGKQIYASSYRNGIPLWQLQTGGIDSDEAVKIIPSENEGYALLCNSVTEDPVTSVKSSNMRLILLDPDGKIISNTVFGGLSAEKAYDMIDTDDGYLVVGSTISFAEGVNSDGIAVKFDNEGNYLWKQVYTHAGESGVTAINRDGSSTIIASYVVDSVTAKTCIMISYIDDSAQILANEVLSSSGNARPSAVRIDNDYIYITGNAFNRPSRGDDGVVIKAAQNLSEMQRIYIGNQYDDRLNDMIVMSDDTIAVAGFITKSGGYRDRDSYLLLLNEDLEMVQENIFDNNNVNDELNSLCRLPSDGYLLGGYIFGSVSDDIYLLYTDSTGRI